MAIVLIVDTRGFYLELLFHDFPQYRIHSCLVALAIFLQPCDYIGIQFAVDCDFSRFVYSKKT